MKKIALVSFANQPGGVARHMGSIVAHLNGRGLSFKVIICSKAEDAVRDALLAVGGLASVDIIAIPHASKTLFFPFMAALVHIFRREQFDLVDAFDDQTQVLAGLAARFAGIKAFLCHNEGRFSPSTVARPKRMLYRVMNALLNGYFTRTIAVSRGIARELIDGGLRPKDKVEVLNLGIKVGDDQGAGFVLHGLAAGAPMIGAISRLSREKGLERFIRAAAIIAGEIPRARFIIYGEGPAREALIALAGELSLRDRMEFRPWTRDVTGALGLLDIYVFPSLREGLPTSLLEAMGAGRPVVASDIDGVREVIDNGVDGMMVDTSDCQSFAHAVVSLCRDEAKAILMGRKAFEKVRACFDVEREMQRLREIYLEICHGEAV